MSFGGVSGIKAFGEELAAKHAPRELKEVGADCRSSPQLYWKTNESFNSPVTFEVMRAESLFWCDSSTTAKSSSWEGMAVGIPSLDQTVERRGVDLCNVT